MKLTCRCSFLLLPLAPFTPFPPHHPVLSSYLQRHQEICLRPWADPVERFLARRCPRPEEDVRRTKSEGRKTNLKQEEWEGGQEATGKGRSRSKGSGRREERRKEGRSKWDPRLAGGIKEIERTRTLLHLGILLDVSCLLQHVCLPLALSLCLRPAPLHLLNLCWGHRSILPGPSLPRCPTRVTLSCSARWLRWRILDPRGREVRLRSMLRLSFRWVGGVLGIARRRMRHVGQRHPRQTLGLRKNSSIGDLRRAVRLQGGARLETGRSRRSRNMEDMNEEMEKESKGKGREDERSGS